MWKEIAPDGMVQLNDQAPFLSFVSKMLNKFIGQRDWSAQEVSPGSEINRLDRLMNLLID
jgi:hypothetical protein